MNPEERELSQKKAMDKIMNIGETLHGFTVREVRHLAELKADMVEMTCEKNGARLIWLDRDDTNMTFGIAFKTTPEDDTGVFHILEHSVLCGSEKYPVKEPFVNLIKTSLHTFLNALTFSDKTLYPISSRNPRDFLNLTGVYLDAVFHPAILKNPGIFQQEGWHYELSDEDILSRSGVVYSEMKGAYTSVERQLYRQLSRQLFPDNCYGFESGGAPEAIPTLTYEKFVAAYRRYYHPSNAYIVLDGKIPVEETFALLESYLEEYDRSAEPLPVIAEQAPVDGGDFEGLYEVGEEDPTENRSQYLEGYVFGKTDDPEKVLGLSVLSSVITWSNESPLCRAVLEKKLAETVYLEVDDSTEYLQATVVVKNTSPQKKKKLKKVIRETLEKLAREGLDKEQLLASINILEFSARERDFGRTPKGLVYGMQILGSWLYGFDPAKDLVFGDIFDRLRARIGEGWFEKLLSDAILNNPHRASVWLDPSVSLGKERRAADIAGLKSVADAMSGEEKEKIRAGAAALLKAQQTPDSPEALSALPVLPLSEVSDRPDIPALTETAVLGRPVCLTEADTSGILYADLYFDASDLSPEELSLGSLLSALIAELPTDKHDILEIQTLLKMHVGDFSNDFEVYAKAEDIRKVSAYFVTHLSILNAKEDVAAGLTAELLRGTVYEDAERIGQIISQRKLSMREHIMAAGSSYASGRVSACYSAAGVMKEYLSGLEQYNWLTKAEKELKEAPEAFCARLTALAKKLVTRSRLTVSLTGAPSSGFAGKLIASYDDDGVSPVPFPYEPFGKRREAIVIPSEISFSAFGINLNAAGLKYAGEMSVAASFLTYSHLWDVIRVQNGAYGVSMAVTNLGALRFSTYRDPNVIGSLDVFRGIGDALAETVPDMETLKTLIIGAVGESDPLRTPRMTGKAAMVYRFSGIDPETPVRNRREMLETTPEKLTAFAQTLKTVVPDCAYCVIGSRTAIEAASERFDSVASLA